MIRPLERPTWSIVVPGWTAYVAFIEQMRQILKLVFNGWTGMEMDRECLAAVILRLPTKFLVTEVLVWVVHCNGTTTKACDHWAAKVVRAKNRMQVCGIGVLVQTLHGNAWLPDLFCFCMGVTY